MKLGTDTKIMIDSNIWISGFLFHGNEMKIILDMIIKGIQPSICITIINELDLVLSEKFGFSREIVNGVLDVIISMSMIEDEIEDHILLRDQDIRILETASSANCDLLITGDKRLLGKVSHGRLKIISTRDFIYSKDNSNSEINVM
ncbi:MAG: putative toxin-antitoxin system toxin component, PIN family [Thermoplasmatota archaeon]